MNEDIALLIILLIITSLPLIIELIMNINNLKKNKILEDGMIKIIIEISEDDYKWILENDIDDFHELSEGIRNGTIIDKRKDKRNDS